MASKRRVKKKSIKEDQLVTTAVKASQWIQEYFTQVVVGVVILVVAVAVIIFVANSRRGATVESERDLAIAMSEYNARNNEAAAVSFARLAERRGGQPAGKVARFFLGKSYLNLQQYQQAMEAFEAYNDAAGRNGDFAVAATIGIALAHEGLKDFGAAARVLEQLSHTMDPEDPRYVEVVFQAARDYQKTNARESAIELYTIVNEKATGRLKDRAAVSLALLE